MNDKKVKNLVIVTAFFLLLAGAVMFFAFDRLDMTKHKTNNYVNYNINDYVEISSLIFEDYKDVYSSINVSKVNIKNLDYYLTTDFMVKQEEIIDNITGFYNQIDVNDNYIPSNTVSSDNVIQMNGTILSIFYKIDFNLDKNVFSDNTKSYVVTTNIDLVTNKVLTEDDLLSKYNYTKAFIADKLFNEVILIEKGQTVIDKETNILLTKGDIERKKEQYVERIITEFDNIIDMYIEDGFLVLVYDTKELKNIFFNNKFNVDIKFRYLK